ncbi:BTB/POZ domain-containing protein-like [Forsythia ovata]|uniref:BTB/POZ domain-containing protein-like n=1 Tax=Forsythia ovata TaxID=205694 RepID=A0ABD1Q006_9LAMI
MILVALVAVFLEEYTMVLVRVLEHVFHQAPLPFPRRCIISATIGFDAGVLSCLEYLEAAPWAEDEEAKVALLLLELRLEGIGAEKVLKSVSLDVTSGVEDRSDSE